MAGQLLSLRPSRASADRGFLRLHAPRPDGAREPLFVPTAPGLGLFLWRRDGALLPTLTESEGTLTPVGGVPRIAIEARRRLTFLRRGVIDYGDFEIVPDGPEPLARSFVRHVRTAHRHGWSFAGKLVRAYPELVSGWTSEALALPAPPPPRGRLKTAFALHLYYTDLWPEIAGLLRRTGIDFDLFVSVCEAGQEVIAQIHADFPTAKIRITENSGRDIRPFLQWLEEGALDGYDAVCKIHGKRALGGGRLPIFGDVWRRATFLDLFAEPKVLSRTLERFETEPQLGLIGPARMLSASTRTRPVDVLGLNRPGVERLMQSLGSGKPGLEFDFFEGSMFWLRPAALAPLRALGLALSAFEAEAGRVDGGLEHAVERAFNFVVRAAGFHVSEAGVDL